VYHEAAEGARRFSGRVSFEVFDLEGQKGTKRKCRFAVWSKPEAMNKYWLSQVRLSWLLHSLERIEQIDSIPLKDVFNLIEQRFLFHPDTKV
jgi:hypothetical protein